MPASLEPTKQIDVILIYIAKTKESFLFLRLIYTLVNLDYCREPCHENRKVSEQGNDDD